MRPNRTQEEAAYQSTKEEFTHPSAHSEAEEDGRSCPQTVAMEVSTHISYPGLPTLKTKKIQKMAYVRKRVARRSTKKISMVSRLSNVLVDARHRRGPMRFFSFPP